MSEYSTLKRCDLQYFFVLHLATMDKITHKVEALLTLSPMV